MFTKKDKRIFLISAVLLIAGFTLMILDPAENGFGVYTLCLAPPLLLSGFILPVTGIVGLNPGAQISEEWKRDPLKHSFGALAFLIAFATYLFTLEPTASLWDCSEFIASAYKLQVPHTPGTPLSLLVGRFFTFFSFGDVTKVAWTLNMMSGLSSAMTVWLLFYLIHYFGKQLSSPDSDRLTLTLSSFGGSLCLAVSDSFWFSAVEAETYGLACFFLLLILWLILTGKDLAEPARSRRLILIFYLAGLAYCIHPMCLLAIPALPFTWYTTGRKLTLANALVTLGGGLAIILLINRFVAVGLFELAFTFDLFAVNVLNLPFYSGAVILLITTIAFIRILLKKYQKMRSYIWASIFLVLGFTPYLLLFIRSNHNPPIDEFNPENLVMIKAYMNRESYPSSPLLYGPYFDAKVKEVTTKRQIYYKSENAYKAAGSLPQYKYDARQTFLPRIYSNDPAHIEAYRKWTGLKQKEKPRFSDNLTFMFRYQIGHMYLRYLMWNFAGRQGGAQDSGWLKPWERLKTSPFESARNQYWMIPLILGLAGATLQFRKDPKGFVSMLSFFLITGIVLVLYLNSTPNQPRERDYIYVGSYIAFAIWIGLGMLCVARAASKHSWKVAATFGISLPLWMLYQNYDDHNRSGRTFQMDNARSILTSCAPNSILFTGGDNDTFPLWYLQEVEGFRTDVRVMVLSYMNADWYINQLRRRYYNSLPFELTLSKEDYRQYGPNDVLYLQETIKTAIDAKQYLQLLKAEHPALRQVSRTGEPFHILPSRSLVLTSDDADRDDKNNLVLTLDDDYLSKNALAIIDLIISNGRERPIHFNFTSMNTLGLHLAPYLVDEGPVYRLVPDRNSGETIPVNTKVAYRNLVELADYSNLQDSTVYFSFEDHYARILVPIRQSFNMLAVAFLDEGNHEMAEAVLTHAVVKLYQHHLRPSFTNLQAAEIFIALGRNELAEELAMAAFEYFFSRVKIDMESGTRPDDVEKYVLQQAAELLGKLGRPEHREEVEGLVR